MSKNMVDQPALLWESTEYGQLLKSYFNRFENDDHRAKKFKDYKENHEDKTPQGFIENENEKLRSFVNFYIRPCDDKKNLPSFINPIMKDIKNNMSLDVTLPEKKVIDFLQDQGFTREHIYSITGEKNNLTEFFKVIESIYNNREIITKLIELKNEVLLDVISREEIVEHSLYKKGALGIENIFGKLRRGDPDLLNNLIENLEINNEDFKNILMDRLKYDDCYEIDSQLLGDHSQKELNDDLYGDYTIYEEDDLDNKPVGNNDHKIDDTKQYIKNISTSIAADRVSRVMNEVPSLLVKRKGTYSKDDGGCGR